MNPNLVKDGEATRFTPENAPKGRKNAGLSLIEHMNAMQDWSKNAVQAVCDDESEGIIKRRAAERLLDDKDVWNVVEHTNHRPLNKSDTTIHDDSPRDESEREEARDRTLARIRGRINRAT